jgi:hypothetical protein
MRATVAALWLLSLVAVFGIAHYWVPSAEARRLASIASFRSALDEPNDLVRTYRMSAFLQGMTAAELPDALQALEARHLWLSPEDLRLFTLAWARFDPAGALARLSTWPENARDMARGAAIYAWAYYDPSAALKAVEAVESKPERAQLQYELVAGWSSRDQIQDLSDWITALPEGQTRQRYAGSYARALLRRGPEALLAWADAVPVDANDGFKATAVLKAAHTLAHQDPLRAKDWIEGQLDQSYARHVAPAIVRLWAKSDPKAALDWSRALASEDDRNRSVSQAYRAWLQIDPEQATEWLRTNTPSDSLDMALRIEMQSALTRSPKTAMEWAERMENPKRREQSVREVAIRWKRMDPEAMGAWLAKASISDELRHAITETPTGPSRPGRQPLVRRPRRRPPEAFQRGKATHADAAPAPAPTPEAADAAP